MKRSIARTVSGNFNFVLSASSTQARARYELAYLQGPGVSYIASQGGVACSALTRADGLPVPHDLF